MFQVRSSKKPVQFNPNGRSVLTVGCNCPDNGPRIRELEQKLRSLDKRLRDLTERRPRRGPAGDAGPPGAPGPRGVPGTLFFNRVF